MTDLSPNELHNPIRPSDDTAEKAAAALATRFLDCAADIVARSNACDRVQDYKKEISKTLIPALLHVMAASYTDSQYLKFLQRLSRIEETLNKLAANNDILATAQQKNEG